jgi:hypothetical protein
MISTRYAAATALAIALALVPTVIHSYLGLTVDDGVVVQAVPETIEGMPSRPTERRADWVATRFDTADWIERTYRVGAEDVTLFVGRSYDAKRLYHHPELALLRGTTTMPAGVARVKSAPHIPLHVVKTSRQTRTGVSVYALLADGEFIENPIAYQLRTSARLLVGGRRPMTLIMATDLAGDKDRLNEAPATKLLIAAIGALRPARAD